MTARLVCFLALACAAAPVAAQPAAPASPNPDSLVLRAFLGMIGPETRYLRFAQIAQTDNGPEEHTTGRLISHMPPPDGNFLWRVDFDGPGEPTIARDTTAIQHRYPRNRRTYVDADGSSLNSSQVSLLALHPAFSLFLHELQQGAESASYVGRDTAAGRPCDRTRVVSQRGDDGVQLTVLPCFDVGTGFVHHMGFEVDPSGSRAELLLTLTQITPGPPPDTTFTLPLPEGWQQRAYDGSDRPALIAAGTAAPAFTLLATDGTPVRLADLRGQFVLLDFWGTWCAPCLADIPRIQALADAHADLVVLGMASFEEPEADPEDVARSHGARYRIVPTDDATVEAYRVEAVPAYVLIGRDGAVLYSALHDDDETALDRLDTLIRSLMAR